ncbi:MAG: hypothetical protein RLZZ344_965 [Pseudomonadota bacterium]|jgi:pilus assembly protein FimV
MNSSRLPLALIAVALSLPAASLIAQPMPDTARALKTLMEGNAGAGNGGPSGGEGPHSAPQASPNPMAGIMVAHTVRPGETLAKVVHQVYGSHPYKDTPVFRLIVQRNPEAFIGGNHNRLKAGATLSMPHPAELHAALTAQHPQFQSIAASRNAAGSAAGSAGVSTAAGQGAVTSPASGKSVYPGPSAAAGQSTSSGDPRRGWIRFP